MKKKKYSLNSLLKDKEFEKILNSLLEAEASEEELEKVLEALL